MPSTLVRSMESAMMNPPSSFLMPSSSRPISSITGSRPMPTISASAWTVFSLPLASLRRIVTPSLVMSMSFAAGRSATANNEARGQLLEHDRMVRVDHGLAVERDALDRARPGAGIDDDVLRLNRKGRAAVLGRDADGRLVE